MFGEIHDIPHEFPEYQELIGSLTHSNQDFQRVFTEYHVVDNEIRDIEQNIEAVSDFYTENLKKKRLVLKDQIYATLQAHSV